MIHGQPLGRNELGRIGIEHPVGIGVRAPQIETERWQSPRTPHSIERSRMVSERERPEHVEQHLRRCEPQHADQRMIGYRKVLARVRTPVRAADRRIRYRGEPRAC